MQCAPRERLRNLGAARCALKKGGQSGNGCERFQALCLFLDFVVSASLPSLNWTFY